MSDPVPPRPKLTAAQQALLQQRLRGKAGAGDDLRPAPRTDRIAPAALSFAQQRLWFLDRLEPGGSTYNMPSALRLSGPLDADALERSLNELIRRHEILRTNFASETDEPVQIIAPALELKLRRVDLRNFSESERVEKIPQLVNEEANGPFDLSHGPLLRAVLFQLAPEEHVLSVTFHHIVSDGWSSAIFWNELTEVYNAFRSGRPSPLTPLPLQYADYAVWQRRWLQGPVLEKQVAYWKKQLQGSAPLLELPTDRPRPAVQTYRGTVQRLSLPPTLTAALKNLGRQNDTTLYVVLLAAFQTLLHRYSRQEDLLVGSVVAGRNQSETESLIGFFVNTLVMRADLSGDPVFTEFLRRVRESALSAFDHQDLPFEKLVEELKPARNQSHHPFFQTMFAFQSAGGEQRSLEGLQASPLLVERGTAKFDLGLELTETTYGLHGFLEFNLDLFDATTIARMREHFVNLLEGIVAQPGARLSALPLLSSAERHQLLVEWNDARTTFPPDRCLHQLFEAQVERTPDAVALSCEGQRLSYRELNARANQLAHHLRQCGVGPDVMVGICMERSFDLLVGLLGILKAGGAYLPIDLTYPKDRLAFMLEDAKAPVLLTQTKLTADLPAHQAKVICLDDPQLAALRSQPSTNPAPLASPENLAYVIFTSGSTGKPKGALITHHNVVRLMQATDPWFHFNERDVWTLFHSYAFDFSVWEIWGALLYGGRLVVVPYLTSRSPEAFYELLGDEKVTVLNQTPSAFRQLMQAEQNASPPRELVLRYVIFGGEALEMQSLKPWFDRHGDQRPQLVNMYGITETTVHVTYRPLTRSDVQGGSVIGVPIPDLQVYILDAHRQPVPIGVPGEMFVGGAGLARGYLNRPELTADRFIANSFSDDPNARLYKTGDLARFLPGRDIEYLGRIDHQVKVRGFRIELGEIESVLCQHPAVREAVVLVREDTPGDQRLVGYLTTKNGANPGLGELRDHLKIKLPVYMVPGAFVFLDKLPLTGNGKVDRRALPVPEKNTATGGGKEHKPLITLSVQITEIWQEVLGLPHVGQRDNFFEIGGHSLLAVKMMERVGKICGRKLPVALLFAGATIEQLAIAVAQNEAANPRPLIEIQTGGTQAPFFFLHGDLSGGGFYCVNLSRLIGADQPFYVLPPQTVTRDHVPGIEAMAAHHLQIVRAHTPRGPYRLGGYCAGGLIALEMARQLQAQGETVELVALVDAPANYTSLKLGHTFIERYGALRGFDTERKVRLMMKVAPHLFQWERTAGFGAMLRYFADKFKRIRRKREPRSTLPPADEDPIAWYMEIVMASFNWSIAGYRMKSYAGPLALFCSSDLLADGGSRVAHWQRLYPQLEVHPITGDHLTSITKHAGELAEKLRGCFDRVARR